MATLQPKDIQNIEDNQLILAFWPCRNCRRRPSSSLRSACLVPICSSSRASLKGLEEATWVSSV